jgi:hypothetical protein
MKERPTEANTPRTKVREVKDVAYQAFDGKIGHIVAILNNLRDEGGWEGIEVKNVYWNTGAAYQVYRFRQENDKEYGDRLRRLQGEYDSKMKKFLELRKELEG